MKDYEREYQRNKSACGEPFPEFVDFFVSLAKVGSTVLDLGCGQGRDALMIASRGHIVCGVDISPTGISQMIELATGSGLTIEGIVADIREYEPVATFDVVLLDRVLHMLSSVAERIELLAKAASSTAEGGYVLVADTPSNIPLIDRFFDETAEWRRVFSRKGFRFFRRV